MQLSDDDFTLFGLPQRFALERTELDARWRALQAEAHPDRFAANGASAQRVAMQWSVRINEAYGRLKDPLSRAAYLCELRGAPLRAEDNTAMPADFLMQQMAWREALDDAVTPLAIDALDVEVRDEERRRLTVVAEALDGAGSAAQAASEIRALMFLARFRQDIARRLESLEH